MIDGKNHVLLFDKKDSKIIVYTKNQRKKKEIGMIGELSVSTCHSIGGLSF